MGRDFRELEGYLLYAVKNTAGTLSLRDLLKNLHPL